MNLDIPSDLQPTLETLRKHYQGIVDYANGQLAHAESLLSKPVLSLNPLSVTPLAEIVKPAPLEEPVPTDAKTKAEPVVLEKPKKAPRKASSKPDKPAKSVAPKVAPKVAATAKASTKVKPSDLLGLRAKYQGKTIIVAIGEALESRKGENVSTADLVTEIHGPLSPDLFKLAKDRLGKSLSKGKVDGLWYTVPGKIGYYTFLKP